MARVFITGSSDGLGLMAAKLLIEQGHEVVLHGRNEGRSRDALLAAVGSQGVVSGDLSTIAGATTVANEVNKLGRFRCRNPQCGEQIAAGFFVLMRALFWIGWMRSGSQNRRWRNTVCSAP